MSGGNGVECIRCVARIELTMLRFGWNMSKRIERQNWANWDFGKCGKWLERGFWSRDRVVIFTGLHMLSSIATMNVGHAGLHKWAIWGDVFL